MSRSGLIAAGLVLLSGALSGVAAQEPVGGTVPEPMELRLDRGGDRVLQVVMNRRARLGLKINLRARATDSVGAYVEAVTPNGPAAKAGIQSGDIITKVDGKSVLAGGQAEGGSRESLPGLRLVELAAKLEPSDTVPIEFRRGKDRKTVSVITADEPDVLFRGGEPGGRSFAFRFRPDGPTRAVIPLDDLEERVNNSVFLAGSRLADLELRGGDVVLAVDGRKPAGPSHLLRILRSYERGETFKLDILRNGKRGTVTGQVGAK